MTDLSTTEHALLFVGVGGLGFGRGQSSYVSAPWLRVQFFKKVAAVALPARPGVVRPEAAKPPAGEKINTYEEALEKPGKEISPL